MLIKLRMVKAYWIPIPISLYGQLHHSLLQRLEAWTMGADFDYVVVKPAGSDRKYVVASELLPSLSEKFGWEDVEVLATYQGKELDHIVTEHPWDLRS